MEPGVPFLSGACLLESCKNFYRILILTYIYSRSLSLSDFLSPIYFFLSVVVDPAQHKAAEMCPGLILQFLLVNNACVSFSPGQQSVLVKLSYLMSERDTLGCGSGIHYSCKLSKRFFFSSPLFSLE